MVSLYGWLCFVDVSFPSCLFAGVDLVRRIFPPACCLLTWESDGFLVVVIFALFFLFLL